ncbi:ZmpA/ZmpB/ZmpC family metallo-endopeptidase, partial [Ligilactobacillus faecis]
VSEESKVESVGYETQYVADPELLEGTTSVRTPGQAGERTIVYEVTRDATGKEISRVEKSNTITKVPVTEVIARGTKVKEPEVTVSEESKVESVGYETQYVADPELLEGTTSVRTPGQAGERTIVYEVTRDATGKEISRVEKSNTITKAPVTEVIAQGTKPKTTVTEEVLVEKIPYTSEIQSDPELFVGTTVVKTAGQAGERTIVYEVTRDTNGKELARVEKSDEITKVPVNEVVAKGTKLYAKPLVELVRTEESADNRVAAVSYTVTDPNKKLQAIKVSLYKENEKITEKLVDLATLTTTFADLAYNTNYRLETEYTYDIGQGDQTENLKPITVELTPKKVELKNVDNISLYQLGTNGGLELVSSLAELPTDPNKYVAKIVSRQQKDWYLPVASFEEIKLGEKTKYQATIATPELVTYQADKRDFSTGHTFLIDKTEVSNEYTNFAELIKAIKADPTGDFILAADLNALGFAGTDANYITETFSGTLRSKAGNSYTISNLNKPLFNVVKGATIANILLENVEINDNIANTGSLARVLDGALISNVNIKGTIASTQTTGGLAARIKNNTQISRASFTGTITLTGNAYDQGGGLVGYAENSRIARSFADVYLTAKVYNTNDNVGGLVGRLASGVVEKSYATGTIKNDGLVKRAGGLIGSAWTNGRVVDAISAVKMENGYIFHGDVDFKRPPHQKTYYVSEVASGLTNDYPTAITEATAKEMIQNWQVAAPTWKAATVAQIIDYSQLPKYQAERELAYRNMEKLLPFYDRYTILKYGNKVLPSDKLYTTALTAVVPMKAGKVVGDSVVEPGQLTSLLLHFADETVTKVALESLGEYKQTNISEYQFANGLLYTPYQLGGEWDQLLTEVVTAYQTLNYYATETTASLALQPAEDSLKKAKKTALENYQKMHPAEVLTAEKTAAIEAKAVEQLRIEQLNELYLQDAFAKVQKDIKAQLGSLTTSMAVVDLNSAVIREDLKQRLEAKKLELTLALAYLERLYHINYGELDLHAIAAYYPDFYGKKVDILSWLSDFSKQGTKLAVKNNYATYAALFSQLTGDQDVVTYLEHNRRLFAPQLDDNTWFKGATKAYVYEAASKQVPDATVQIYDRLKGKNRLEYLNYLLPLLNLSEKNMFMFTTMTTVSFGIYERYIDEALKSAPTVYAAKQANIDRAVDKYAQVMADYYDTWYRIVDDKVKNQLLTRDIPIWDGYWIIDNTKTGSWKNRWVDKFDKSVSGVYEFFAPVGKMYAPNGVGAYATGSLVNFVVDGQLSDYGVAVSSHEMTHNLDGAVYFNGYDRRQEMGAETFAMGLLEVPSTPDQSQYGLNLAFDWSNKKNLTQASSFSDFTSSADLKRYMKGVFDVTYLLDYAEAQAIVAMSNADRRQYLRQITYDTNAKQDKITNSGLTYAEGIKLTSWESLIDNNIVVARSLSGGSYGKNAYMTVPLYAPIYAGLQNDNGSVGGLLFRKTAFELLADRGWEEGFIPYVSNQYKNQAKAEGEVFGDAYIFKQIWGTEYANYAEFKKAMFNERIAKKDNLRAITITYNKKQETIDSFAKLQTLMDQASAADMLLMRAGKRAVNVDNLKKAIMVEYHSLTDSFKTSIFN